MRFETPKLRSYTTPPMPKCKDPCKHHIVITMRENIYDVSVDDAWMFSRSSYKNVLDELSKLFTMFEGQ